MKKKFISILLAVLLVVSMSAFAFGANKVTSIESGVFVSSIDYTSGNEFDVGSVLGDIYQDFSPGAAINIFLDPSKFAGGDFTPETGMSARDLENAGVTFRIAGGTNSNLIKDVSYKEKTLNGNRVAMIQIQLVDNLVSTEAKDFETTLTVYLNKNRQQSISVGGVIGSETQRVGANEGYLYLGDGTIAEATEAVNNIEIDAGEQVTLHARLHKGKKYYAVARMTPTNADIEIMNDNAEIDSVYYLDTSGFNAGDATVSIKLDATFYAYDSTGKYLGTTDEKLPLTSKYYLTTEKVTLKLPGGTDSSITEPDFPEEPTSGDYLEPTSGDTQDPNTHIPDTGVPQGVKLAVFAMVAGLAILVILGIKGKKKK